MTLGPSIVPFPGEASPDVSKPLGSVKVDTKNVTLFSYVTGFHVLKPIQPEREPEPILLDALRGRSDVIDDVVEEKLSGDDKSTKRDENPRSSTPQDDRDDISDDRNRTESSTTKK